jgi:flagellin
MQMYVRYGQSDGTFGDSTQYAGPDHMSELAAGDINTDGITDLVTGATVSSDVVYVWLGNVDGTFSGTISYATGDDPNSLTIADFNGDGVDDIASANKLSNNYTVFLAETTRSAHTEYLTLTTVDGAKEALETISAAQQRVSAELGNIGAVQSRLSHTVNHLQVMRENYAAANSKIVDADIAEEVAQMVRQQILQQAITAVMAQANQQSALVLQLLK